MISQQAIEESVLALLVYSEEHAPLIALKIVDAKLFSNKPHETIARTALDYLNKYTKPPKGQLEYLLENELRRGEEGKLLRNIITDLGKAIVEIDPSFILEQLDHFLQSQKLTNSLQNALEFLQQGELDKAREEVYKSSSAPLNGSSGLWMKDPRQALKFLDADEQGDFFSSGIELLDIRGIRPERKTLSFIIASTGKGKSWWLIAVGKAALQHHKKVLHITLELSAEKTARRYIQSIFGLTKDEAKHIQASSFIRDEHGLATSVNLYQMYRESVVTKRKEIYDKLEKWESCPEWLIKDFPTSTLSVEHLSLYLDSLEKEEGFKPDLLVIDYADLMKINAESFRIDTGRLYRELRGLGGMKDVAVVSATQGNRDSEDAKTVGITNVGEDWSKVGTADVVLTYSQTPEEFARGLARIYVAKGRDERDRFMALISQCYDIGQFALDSVPMSPALSEEISKAESA